MAHGISLAARAALLPGVLLILALLPAGCGDELTPPAGDPPVSGISGTLAGTIGCKDNLYGMQPGSIANLDCVSWEWDGADTLRVVHVNAALNCCPGTIAGTVVPIYYDEMDPYAEKQLVGFNITENEGDDAIMCRCLCLYDLSYDLTGITGGTIFLRFYEKYIGQGAEPLYAVMDLDSEPVGSACVFRDMYPWGTEQTGDDPVGTIDYNSGCKVFDANSPDYIPGSADSACALVITDPSSGTMHITLQNTAYNCCVDAIDAEFGFDGNLITITGREHPQGGLCDCICLYDVSYTVSNLAPAVFTITFVEPYLLPGQEPLEIEVDMSVEGAWSACAYRSGYPWGEETDEEADKQRLAVLYRNIVEYIGTPSCHGNDCRYIGVGSKPCGGPWHYMVYSASTVNEEYLRALVEIHAAFENYMNYKYGYCSDCSVPVPPVVECRNGVCREAVR
jgi:hypothetical protein